MKPANPYTRDDGYRYAAYDWFCGWFVVYDSHAMEEPMSLAKARWYVECKKLGRRIYTASLEEARMIAVRAADSAGFTKWDWAFQQSPWSVSVAAPDPRGFGRD